MNSLVQIKLFPDVGFPLLKVLFVLFFIYLTSLSCLLSVHLLVNLKIQKEIKKINIQSGQMAHNAYVMIFKAIP